jgi:GAF domain-containing protein
MKGLFDTDNGRVGLDRVVALAHCHRGLDVVFLAELTAAGQVYRAVAGDAPSFEIVLNRDGPSDAAYSRRLVAGEIPNVIHDAATDARVSELPATRQARIGSFIGVPVRLSDGTSYGALCGLSHAPD